MIRLSIQDVDLSRVARIRLGIRHLKDFSFQAVTAALELEFLPAVRGSSVDFIRQRIQAKRPNANVPHIPSATPEISAWASFSVKSQRSGDLEIRHHADDR